MAGEDEKGRGRAGSAEPPKKLDRRDVLKGLSTVPAIGLFGYAWQKQRDYQQALIELRRVSEAYPRSPHVPDALLKIGLCQRALGDRAAASAAWEQAIRDHPGSAAADQARTLLGGRDSAARGTP